MCVRFLVSASPNPSVVRAILVNSAVLLNAMISELGSGKVLPMKISEVGLVTLQPCPTPILSSLF